jgi:hypothetical protein
MVNGCSNLQELFFFYRHQNMEKRQRKKRKTAETKKELCLMQLFLLCNALEEMKSERATKKERSIAREAGGCRASFDIQNLLRQSLDF